MAGCVEDIRRALVRCGSGTFSLEERRITPLPIPVHVVRGDYLECFYLDHIFILPNLYYLNCAYN